MPRARRSTSVNPWVPLSSSSWEAEFRKDGNGRPS
jgi:hypothetical protein